MPPDFNDNLSLNIDPETESLTYNCKSPVYVVDPSDYKAPVYVIDEDRDKYYSTVDLSYSVPAITNTYITTNIGTNSSIKLFMDNFKRSIIDANLEKLTNLVKEHYANPEIKIDSIVNEINYNSNSPLTIRFNGKNFDFILEEIAKQFVDLEDNIPEEILKVVSSEIIRVINAAFLNNIYHEFGLADRIYTGLEEINYFVMSD